MINHNTTEKERETERMRQCVCYDNDIINNSSENKELVCKYNFLIILRLRTVSEFELY